MCEISNIEHIDNNKLIDTLHINLMVISKIIQNDKLIINNGILNIDRSYLQSITRWYGSNDRKKTIDFINNIIEQTFKLIDDIIVNQSFKTLSSESRDDILQRFRLELKNSINGLANLKITYINDNLMTSNIDVIIENINNKVIILNKLFKIND